MYLSKASGGESQMLRHKRVILELTVKGNASAALVQHAPDAPDSVFLQTEGNDDVSAQDAGATFGTIENNNAGASIMGVLIDSEKLFGKKIGRLYPLTVTEVTSTAGTVTSALKGVSSSGITASGNIALTIAGTTADLSSDTVTYRIVLEGLLEA